MKASLVLLALVFSSFAFGSNTDSDRFNYDGSRKTRSVDLLTELTRTEYRYVQVPYQERVCRTETRYRQECRTGPARRVCQTAPGRQVCRNIPGQRVCRTRPDGRQICRNRPGQRVCHTEPGRRTCRTIPGRRVCNQVPYSERVCRYETRYRQERHAYTVVDSRTNAKLTFNFSQTAFEFLGVNVEVNTELNNDNLMVKIKDLSIPTLLIADQVTRNRSGPRDDLFITENHNIELFKAAELFAPLNGTVRVTNSTSQALVLAFNKVTYQQELTFDLTIKRNQQVIFSRALTLNDYRLSQFNDQSEMSLDLRQLGLKLAVDTVLNVELGMHLNPSKFINADRNTEWSKRNLCA